MARYSTSIKISTGHTPGSRPADWTEITITKTFDVANRAAAVAAIEDYARERGFSPELDAGDGTYTWIDASLV